MQNSNKLFNGQTLITPNVIDGSDVGYRIINFDAVTSWFCSIRSSKIKLRGDPELTCTVPWFEGLPKSSNLDDFIDVAKRQEPNHYNVFILDLLNEMKRLSIQSDTMWQDIVTEGE